MRTAEMASTLEAPTRPRTGRPTKAAAAARDERLLDIATGMFLEQGFDATSMDGLAEAAAIGKATLYARYADKGALFAAVLRRRIPQVFGPMEEEFKGALAGTDLVTMLRLLARRFLEKSTSPESIALGRIVVAQVSRFPDIAKLVAQEGSERHLRLVEGVLAHFAREHAFASDDIPMLADLFLSIALGRISRLALYGISIDPALMDKRIDAAVALFVRGLLVEAHPTGKRM